MNAKDVILARKLGGGGGGATEPYVEETYDSDGNLTAAVLYGLPRIRDHAFYYCDSLASVTIPDSVTEIEGSAFESCSSLTSVTIPNSVVYVYDNAFNGCLNLASVTFNGTPLSIDVTAFENCPNLTTINVPWAEGAVRNAPWGAPSATINYNYTGA